MVKATNTLSVSELKEIFRYEDGHIYWKKYAGRRALEGAEAGRPHKSGYRQVNYKGKPYMVHRVVFALHEGYWPEQVDHKDTDKSNCRIENLRATNNSYNQANRGKTKANTTGRKGVTMSRNGLRYKAQIRKDGVLYYLGTYDTLEEAAKIYEEAAHEFFQEFARV